MSPDVTRTDRELQMMEAMVDCAYALGLAVGEAAKAEADTKKSFALYDLFHKSFLAVRMGIRLSMALRAGPKAARPLAEAAERDEALETERLEPLERGDPPEREEERERDRDYEPVSLPRFLSTLGLVARDAACVDGLPAEVRSRELPALQALLADAKAEPAAFPARTLHPSAGVAVLTRPPKSRAALLGSAAAPGPRPAPRPKPPWSGSG